MSVDTADLNGTSPRHHNEVFLPGLCKRICCSDWPRLILGLAARYQIAALTCIEQRGLESKWHLENEQGATASAPANCKSNPAYVYQLLQQHYYANTYTLDGEKVVLVGEGGWVCGAILAPREVPQLTKLMRRRLRKSTDVLEASKEYTELPRRARVLTWALSQPRL